MTTTEAPPTPVTPAIFDHLATAVSGEILGRPREIHAIMVAILARQHVFALSRPGEAKTLLLERLLSRIEGAVRFSTQLDAFAGDDALFGNISVKRLVEDDVRARSADNLAIQHAHLADIDELARASAATIASLLRIMAERQYQEAGRWKTAPLSTLLASSNSLPWAAGGHDKDRAADLAAIWDRFAIRLWWPPTTDLGIMRRIIDLPAPDPKPKQVLTWDEVVISQSEAAALHVPDDVKDTLITMTRKLATEGIEVPSPRRMNMMLSLARADAWLAGATQVDVGNLAVLTHSFPHDPDQQAIVDKVVLAVAAPLREEIAAVVADIAERATEYRKAGDEANDRARNTRYMEVIGKLKRSAMKLADLERRASGVDREDIDAAWPAIQSLYDTFTSEVLGSTRTLDVRDEALHGRLT